MVVKKVFGILAFIGQSIEDRSWDVTSRPYKTLVPRQANWPDDLLMGLLLGLAKLAIIRSRQRAMVRVVMANCLPLFCGYIRAWVSLEKEHA
eukprot:g45905.t1